jgi:hypothetical protein
MARSSAPDLAACTESFSSPIASSYIPCKCDVVEDFRAIAIIGCLEACCLHAFIRHTRCVRCVSAHADCRPCPRNRMPRTSSSEMSQVPREVHKALADQGLAIRENNVVAMQRNAPAHPRNWCFARKVYETGVLTAFVTISQVTFAPTRESTRLISAATEHFSEM